MPTFDPDSYDMEDSDIYDASPEDTYTDADRELAPEIDPSMFKMVDQVDSDTLLFMDGLTKENVEVTGEAVKQSDFQNFTPSVGLRSVFSRTISEPGKSFGSITATTEIVEILPGTLTGEEIAEITREQFVCLKREVLGQLDLQYEMREDVRRVMETFPGSTVDTTYPPIGTSAVGPATVPPPALVSVPAATTAPSPFGASTAPQNGGPAAPTTTLFSPAPVQTGDGRTVATKSPKEYREELYDFPGDWCFVDADEKVGKRFESLKYVNDKGFPYTLWYDYQGTVQFENPALLNSIFDAGGFATVRPRPLPRRG